MVRILLAAAVTLSATGATVNSVLDLALFSSRKQNTSTVSRKQNYRG